MSKDANVELIYSDNRFSILRCKLSGLMVCVPKMDGDHMEWIEPHEGHKLKKYIAIAA